MEVTEAKMALLRAELGALQIELEEAQKLLAGRGKQIMDIASRLEELERELNEGMNVSLDLIPDELAAIGMWLLQFEGNKEKSNGK